jgi:hypothetical protein
MTQNHGFALARRQGIQRPHQGRLAIRLDQVLHSALGLIGGFWPVIQRLGTATPSYTVNAKIHRHFIGPSGNFRIPAAPGGGGAPNAQHHLLGDIFGLGAIAQFARGIAQNARRDLRRKQACGTAITRAIARKQRRLIAQIMRIFGHFHPARAMALAP